jgi:glycosyltransferase involved in cell wall biosynthesis
VLQVLTFPAVPNVVASREIATREMNNRLLVSSVVIFLNAEKVRYLEHPGHENRGMSASRNLGITHAKGEYIALLDSDDVWLPHKLQQQVAILNSHPEAIMVYELSEYWHG